MTHVLFVRLSAMGDVVHTLGAAAALRRVRPDWRTTFVTQAAWAPLLRGAPGIDRVVTFDRRGGLRALLAVRASLRRERCDVALDLQGNWKSALVARLSGARERIGMAAPWRQEPASRVLLHRALACDALPHPARAAWELVCALAPDAPFVLPRLVADSHELEAERRALAAAGIDAARAFRVVVVTDARDPRALRPEIVAVLARDAAMPALQLLGPAEEHVAPLAGVPVVRHGAGEVRRLIALGALVAASDGDVVGPDQGASHVLSAAGAFCRVMFGAQDPRRTAPPAASALVHAQPPPCSPCRARACTHPEGPVCMSFLPDAGRRADVGLPAP